jgi:small subunit ribosomal protein S20
LRSATKTEIAKARRLVGVGSLEDAEKAVLASQTLLDKIAHKGVVHPNNASRRKSRLAKLLNRAKQQTPETPQ